MTKQTEKSIAVELRQKGFSYEEIKTKMQADGYRVSKGSLTNWLRNVPLTEEQQAELLRKEYEPGLKAMRKKREDDISRNHAFSDQEQQRIDRMLIDGGFIDTDENAGSD